MTRRPNNTIYDEVVRLAHEYFGPDSARHIGKFIKVHLRKPPEHLTKDELVSMIDWIKNEASYMAEDQHKADQYVRDLLAMTDRDNQIAD